MPKHIKQNKNYYTRLKVLRKVRTMLDDKLQPNDPYSFIPPLAYTYRPETVYMEEIEKHKYMSQFKREFAPIRVKLSNDTYVNLEELKMNHLLNLLKLFQS